MTDTRRGWKPEETDAFQTRSHRMAGEMWKWCQSYNQSPDLTECGIMGKRLREMPLIRLRQRALKLLWQLIADQHLTKISVGVFFLCLILKVYRRLTSWRCGQLKSPSWWGKWWKNLLNIPLLSVVISEISMMCCEKGNCTSPHIPLLPISSLSLSSASTRRLERWHSPATRQRRHGTAHCHFDLLSHLLPLPFGYEERWQESKGTW